MRHHAGGESRHNFTHSSRVRVLAHSSAVLKLTCEDTTKSSLARVFGRPPVSLQSSPSTIGIPRTAVSGMSSSAELLPLGPRLRPIPVCGQLPGFVHRASAVGEYFWHHKARLGTLYDPAF